MTRTNPKSATPPLDAWVEENNVSDEEVDRLILERKSEINALLQEAYDERANGEGEPLEPLHELLMQARENARKRR